MRNKLLFLIGLFTWSMAGAALAESTSDALTRIDAETMVLKAREKQLEVQSNIISKQNEITAKQNMGTQLTRIAVEGNPMVHAIEGIGRSMVATLLLEDGDFVDVRQGDVLSNGSRILKINANEVVIRNKHGTQGRLVGHVQNVLAFNPNLPAAGLKLPVPTVTPREAAK
jgi:type IV pilus biogenesis protein PilP